MSPSPGTGTPPRYRRSARVATRVVALAAAAGLVAAASAACGSGDSGDGDSTTFTYSMTNLPTNLDPAVIQGDPSRHIGFERGSALFQWDTADLAGQGCETLAGAADIKGELAKDWAYADDEKSVRITLRDAKSSFGNTLTGDDVKWSFDRLIALEAGNPNLLMFSTAHYADDPISVVDEHTIDLRLTERTTLDLAVTTWFQFMILDSTEVKKHVTDADPWGEDWLTKNTADFGPWSATEDDFDPGNELTLTANPDYWGERGGVDKLIFKATPNASSRMQLLQSGSVDFADRLSYDQYKSLEGSDDGGVEVQRCVSADRIPLVLSLHTPQFADPDVRRAVSMTIDRDAIIEGVYKGYNLPAKYGLSAAYDFPRTEANTFTHDVDAAKDLIAQSGVGQFDVELTISPTRPGPEAEQIAVLIKDDLAQIGINVTINTIPGDNQFATTFHDGSYQALLYLEPPGIADPFYSLNLYNSSDSYLNSHGYANEEYDALTEQINGTEPGEERSALISQAAEVMVSDPPFVYLVDKEFLHAVDSSFTGWQHPPNGELLVYTLESE